MVVALFAWSPGAQGAVLTPGYWEDWTRGGGNLGETAADGNAEIARLGVEWCSLEPNPPGSSNQWNTAAWNAIINRIKSLRDDGLNPLPVLKNAPSWIRPQSMRSADGSPCGDAPNPPLGDQQAAYSPAQTSASITDWKEFVTAFVDCMQGDGGTCPVNQTENLDTTVPRLQGYEIWNEPNLNKYWAAPDGQLNRGDADYYTRMLQAAYNAVKDEGATRPVVLAGLAYPDMNAFGDDRRVPASDYLDQVYTYLFVDHDLPRKFDKIGIHPYGANLRTTPSNVSSAISLTNGVRSDHGDDAQIWITEVGDDSAASGLTGQKTRLDGIWDLLVGRCSMSVANRIPVMIVYRLVDSPVDGSRDMGVMSSNPTTAKPAYNTLRTDWATLPSC
jgi:hypothetical protein